VADVQQPAKLRFNCYLLRQDLSDVEQALRPKFRATGKTPLKRLSGSNSAPTAAVAFLGNPTENTPKWAKELDTQFPGLGNIRNRSNRFIIFLPADDRWFAVCFGYAAGALEWDAVDSNFGLRLAARRFRPDDVTEFRSRRIDASARTQSVQVPIGTDLRELGVELEGEFARRLAGRLETQGLEDAIDGAVVAGDSIAFKAGTNLGAVQRILRQMLKDVTESAAREEFQFVDSLEPLRSNESVSKELDRRLAAEILESDVSTVADLALDTHVLEFAPPDDIRMEEVEDVIVMNGDKESVMADFTLTSLREALHDVGVRRGVSYLTNVRLMAIGADGEPRSSMLPLRSWLVYEAGDTVARFVLTLGRWFRLQEAYTKKLNADLSKIADVSAALALPTTSASENEGPYNKRTAASSSDFLLMDTIGIATGDGVRVESCDLLHRTGYLVHVKRYNGSQTLSHLFSQGAVSAELLNADSVMKDHFVSEVVARGPSFESAAKRAPEIVTYAIALRDSYHLPLGLPTFSKVNLRDFAKRLQRMKVKPTLARIRVI
jgi:uncharacterized protein (TIGR04141 family)